MYTCECITWTRRKLKAWRRGTKIMRFAHFSKSEKKNKGNFSNVYIIVRQSSILKFMVGRKNITSLKF